MNKGIPTIGPKGIQFRSRIEAQWAYIFTELGWQWEYEPFDLKNYIPDFIIQFTDNTQVLVEIKGDMNIWEESVYKSHLKKIEDSGWTGPCIILGANYNAFDPHRILIGYGATEAATEDEQIKDMINKLPVPKSPVGWRKMEYLFDMHIDIIKDEVPKLRGSDCQQYLESLILPVEITDFSIKIAILKRKKMGLPELSPDEIAIQMRIDHEKTQFELMNLCANTDWSSYNEAMCLYNKAKEKIQMSKMKPKYGCCNTGAGDQMLLRYHSGGWCIGGLDGAYDMGWHNKPTKKDQYYWKTAEDTVSQRFEKIWVDAKNRTQWKGAQNQR